MQYIVMLRQPYKAAGKYIAGVNKNGTLKLTPHRWKALDFSENGAEVLVYALKRVHSEFIVTKEKL